MILCIKTQKKFIIFAFKELHNATYGIFETGYGFQLSLIHIDTSKNGFGLSRQEADHVMKEIQNMDVIRVGNHWYRIKQGLITAVSYTQLDVYKRQAI